MAEYTKKPVTIEAFQFGVEPMPDWFIGNLTDRTIDTFNDTGEWRGISYCLIETLEGTMRANKGDWIIKGVNGEIYPCKDAIFKKTYILKEDNQSVDMIANELYNQLIEIRRRRGSL